MEVLGYRIKAFLNSGSNSGCSYDSRFAYGYGNGFGYSPGFGSVGGSGYGNGSGSGSGFRFNSALDSGGSLGDGFGLGSGSNDGSGHGDGYGDGIKEVNGNHIYMVDGVPTIIKSVHNNVAQGFILQSDLTLSPCYIVKEQNKFAHGKTLHDALTALQEKLYDNSTKEERIEAFTNKFPEYDTPYSNRDLFVYHHVLTGSCKMGRDSFCMDKGINLDGSTTIREFVNLTKDSYGSDIIRKLPEVYGIEE